MKFSTSVAFVAALKFGTVSSESVNEDEFWHRYTQELDSMVISPTPEPTTIDSATPSLVPTEALSLVPTEAPSLSDVSFGPSLGETSIFPSSAPCASIEFILCNVPEFSTVCDMISATGLSASFGEDTYTVFAPINDAFDSIPEEIGVELAKNVESLRNAILYHAVPEMELLASNLVCDGQIMMANQEMSTTICTVDGVFQAGTSNPSDALPQIIARDGAACNGIIHAVDKVLLPSIESSISPSVAPTISSSDAPTYGNETECETLYDIICDLPDFEILCALVADAELVGALSDVVDFTIFAPVNSAFEALPEDLAESVITDSELLEFVLLSHVHQGELFSFDLTCGAEVEMVSETETITTCEGEDLFQVGGGNSAEVLPKIISGDGYACNGVIHAIDNVILPVEARK